jgi:glutamyl-tRNA synthetase
MLEAGSAYRCYMSREELDALRAEQEARKEKPRYDGRWRPEAGQDAAPAPSRRRGACDPFFARPQGWASWAWQDQVKGRIEFANSELDDFIIARADGTPTYNFCVVVDDRDMEITHVIRGDDHVNNTPRQINLLRALGAPIPEYAHLSMILGDDGQKLSKRHGAVSVMEYDAEGYLPEAVLNYLARLGWSHGDDEVFDMDQFVRWFDLDHITSSAAQFNTEKLNWLNAHYLKLAAPQRLAAEATRRLARQGVAIAGGPDVATVAALYRDRVGNLNELADAIHPFYLAPKPTPRDARPAFHRRGACGPGGPARKRMASCAWQAAELGQAVKQTAAESGLKMGQLAIPLRVALLGLPQSPSIDSVLEVLGRERVLERLAKVLAAAAD